MKKTCTLLIILVVAVLMVVPVSADGGNTSNTTVVPTALETLVTTQVTPELTTTTVVENTTTAVPTTTTVPATTPPTTTIPATTVTTTVPVSLVTQASTGNLSVASTPMGAAILIDGVYYGTTPGLLADIPAGNHILRLALSGYYDYEGTIYVVPGQDNSAFGTLPPLSGYSTAPSTTVVTAATAVPTAAPIIIVQPTATETSSAGVMENPTVIAAVIGIITAAIGAGATLYTHKPAEAPKEEKKP